MSIIYQVIAFSLHSLVVKRKSLSFTCRFAKKHMSWYCVCFLECDMSFLDSKVLSIHTNETRYIFVLPILRPFSTDSNSAKYTTLYQGFLSLNQTSVWGWMLRIILIIARVWIWFTQEYQLKYFVKLYCFLFCRCSTCSISTRQKHNLNQYLRRRRCLLWLQGQF